jgi:pantetheine-phosphate adenylyltransferase
MPTTPRVAIFPGTFDPVTEGHRDLITRAARLFDYLTVAVFINPTKTPSFSLDERLAFLREAVKPLSNVEVDAFEGLVADYVKRRGAVAVVRGVRTATEFAEESHMALMNRHLNAGCETVFLLSSASTAHISARLVREIASFGGAVDGLVSPAVAAALAARFPRR